MEKPRFLKSQKINRLSAHLQALWECDLSAAGGRRAVSKKVQGHAQPGISSLNTVSSSPDDHPDDHLGRSVQEMRRARGTQSRQETTPGGWQGPQGPGLSSMRLIQLSRDLGTRCRQADAVTPVRGSRAAVHSGVKVTLGGASAWPTAS